MFLDLLSKAPIKRKHYYYWWRAQSVAYMVQPPIILQQQATPDTARQAATMTLEVWRFCGDL